MPTKPTYEALTRKIRALEKSVADREKIEAALRKSQADQKQISDILETLFDAIPDVLGVQDIDHKIIRYNKAGYRFINNTPDQVIGRKCFEIIGRNEPCKVCATSEVIKTHQPSKREKFVEELGVWLDVRSYPVMGSEGNLSMVIEHLRDITELKNVEIALKRSERKYRQIFNATNDAIVIHDAKTGLILDANARMHSMYGYEAEELIGMSFEEISSGTIPYDKKNAQKKFLKALKDGSTIFEWQSKRKDGTLFWIEMNLRLSVIDDEDKIIAVIRDITERKKTHDVMIQTEKMMSVGGLAAGMAHEINNPLAGMMQSADVVLRRLMDVDLPQNIKAAEETDLNVTSLRRFMEKRDIPNLVTAIKASGSRIAQIINNMLSFSRHGDAEMSSHAITELLDQTIALAGSDFDLKKHYDFKKIKIIKEYEPVPEILCEASKIQQVFFNILKNGSQAMSEHDTPSPCFILKVWFDKTAQMVVIEIEDNGPGMDDRAQKKAFEPFFTTKPAGIGTGLGLSVSYFIITEAHNGQIEVTSNPGDGCKFTIRLNA